MFTTKAVRVLGFAGVAGVFAMLQACTPDAQDVKVNAVDPTVATEGCTVGAAGCTASSSSFTPPASYPRPPQGYKVKWSVCTKWVEGGAAVHNNSRVVNITNGTVPIHRVEAVTGDKNNMRRVLLSKLSKPLVGGKGVDRSLGKSVEFVKIGQVVTTKDVNGEVVQWVVGSENLGEPITMRDGKLAYQDHCFRNPTVGGRDTAGYITDAVDLALACVVEDMNQEWNALFAYGWYPIMNYADKSVPTANNPATRPHPDDAKYEGYVGGTYNYTAFGGSLNDLNGMERDETTNYYSGEGYCHMIVNGGFEVPGSKRPATKSLPAPGIVNGKSLVTWKPVNPNVLIANEKAPVAPDPIEPPPEPSDPVALETDTLPM